MARSNPVFGNDAAFRPSGSGEYAPAPQYNQGFQQAPYGQAQNDQAQFGQTQFGQPAPSAADLNSMFNQPSATGHDTGRVTYRDILNALTATLGVVVLVGGAIMALPVIAGLAGGYEMEVAARGFTLVLAILGMIGSLVFGIWGTVTKKPSPVLTLAYAVFEGLLLGGISSMFESIYPGIVIQAVLATFAVVASILVLFRMGKLRTSPKLTKIFFVALGAYMIFSLVNLALVIFTQTNLRYGEFSWLGVGIGLIAVALASYSLVMDLEVAQNAVANGAPRPVMWKVALGIAITVVWMYVEILRILSILRQD